MNQLHFAGRLAGVLLFICLCASSQSQTICQTGDENSTLSFTAPPGKIFISVTFASYGTPNGSCGSFTIGACHAANSKTIVESALIGQNSASIGANNGVFGDPCGGTVKRLYVEAVYGNSLPLQWLSFTVQKQNEKVLLQWTTASEINTASFVIEHSTDGLQWKTIGSISSNNNSAMNHYSYSDAAPAEGINYYRIRQNDHDGKYSYSEIKNVRMNDQGRTFRVIGNPVVNKILQLQVHSSNQLFTLFNGDGKLIWTKTFSPGMHIVGLSELANGFYFLKTKEYSEKLVVQ